jgi:hypothetical protein
MITRSRGKGSPAAPPPVREPRDLFVPALGPIDDSPASPKSNLKRPQSEVDVDDTKYPRVAAEPFTSCLDETESPLDSPKGHPILARSLSSRELNDEGWLTSPFMDIVLHKFAKSYPGVHFMSSDFAALSLSSKHAKNDYYDFSDILGRKIIEAGETDMKDIVFAYNSNGIHWNLIRVQRHPHQELHLFEPMGKPTRRRGVDSRSMPKGLIAWLDSCYAFDQSWLSVSASAITSQQQFTTYDCGVACLLYAEKCGMKQVRNDS